MNTLRRTSAPKPIARQEVEARQRAREARLAQQMTFPWVRILLGTGTAVVVVWLIGGGLLSLFIAATIAGVLTKGRSVPGFFSRPPRF